jgi:electron transfer flavoprotein beta subunit
MKAKKKPMSRKSPSDFDVDLSPRLTVVKTEEPMPRPGGIKVASVAELIAKLKTEAHIL